MTGLWLALPLLGLLWSAPALAAISGTVVNGSSGDLLPGAVVTLHELRRNGSTPVARTKSDARGGFSIKRDIVGPHLVRTVFDGVAYESILPLGTNAESVTLVVYRSSKEAGAARVRNHTVRFEPASGGTLVSETFQYVNEGAVAWNDPRGATLRFYLPPSAGKLAVRATPPGGTPARQVAARSAAHDIYQVGFPVRPGETEVSVTYQVPNPVGAVNHGQIVTQAEATLLTAASGFELSGTGMRQSGREYMVVGNRYDIVLTAKPDAPVRRVDAALPQYQTNPGKPDRAKPISGRTMPRMYGHAPLPGTPVVVAFGVVFGAVFGLGFIRLYRQEKVRGTKCV